MTLREDAEGIHGDLVQLRRALHRERMANPAPASEDFSFVLAEVPGEFVFLNACPPELDATTAAPNHAPQARFDDGVLADGAALLAELAVRRVTRATVPGGAVPAPRDSEATAVEDRSWI